MVALDSIPDRLKTAAQVLLRMVSGTAGLLLISAVSTGTWPAPTLQWAAVIVFIWVIVLVVVWFHLRESDPEQDARIGSLLAFAVAVWSAWLLFSRGTLSYLPVTVFFAVVAAAGVWQDLRRGWTALVAATG